MSDFVPRAPESVALRPLTKGMVSNAIGTDVPQGAGTVVQGFYVEPQGLVRRPAWGPIFASKDDFGRIPLESGEELQDIIPYTTPAGVFMYVAITNWRLWVLSSSASTWSIVPLSYTSKSADSISSTTLTDASEDFTTWGIRAGDYLRYFSYVPSGTVEITLDDYLGAVPSFNTLDGLTAANIEGGGVRVTYDATLLTYRRITYADGAGIAHTPGYAQLALRFRIIDGSDRAVVLRSYVTTSGPIGVQTVLDEFTVPATAVVGTWYTVYARAGFFSEEYILTELGVQVESGLSAGQSIEIEYLTSEPSTYQAVSAEIESFDATHLYGSFGLFNTFSYSVQHRFVSSLGVGFIDFTRTPSYLLLTDNTADGLIKFDGSVITPFAPHANALDPDPDYLLGAKSVLYFAGRVWLGGTIEDGSDGGRFIRWSSLTDLTEFAVSDYVLFNQETSNVLKLSVVEDVPVVYLENAIYSGYPSSLSGLPFAFIKVESGTISTISPRAIANAAGGQFFVGADNIYFLSSGRQGTSQTLSVEAVGTSILNESVRLMRNAMKTQAIFDRSRETVMFAFTMSTSPTISRTFLLNLRTKAWSYVEAPSSFFNTYALLPTAASTTWADMDAIAWDEVEGVSWSEYDTDVSASNLCVVDVNGVVYAAQPTQTDDSLVQGTPGEIALTPIQTEFDSGDIDFDAPDADKVYTRVALHIEDQKNTTRTLNAEYAVALSGDKGRTWSEKGVIVIEPNVDSDEAHFRFRDDAARLRLVASRTPPLVVSGIMLRVRPGEVHNVRD